MRHRDPYAGKIGEARRGVANAKVVVILPLPPLVSNARISRDVNHRGKSPKE